MNVDHVCKECRFWSQETEVPEENKLGIRGECRRYPPLHMVSTLITVDDEAMREDDNLWTGVWPNTYEDDWCGEFRELS